MRVFVGMETSGVFRRRFASRGYETYSCDLLPAEDGDQCHIQGDVYQVLEEFRSINKWPDFAIFHPTCTFLTHAAEWAFKDPDYIRYPGVGYHQKVKSETLTGLPRRIARELAMEEFRFIIHLPIKRKVIENPRGVLSSIRKPTQIIQPYEHGDDASKATCLWYVDKDGNELSDMIIPVNPEKRVPGRIVNGVERWSNQTDSGENRVSPGPDRWKERSRTYPGFADDAVAHWSTLL